MLVVKRKVVVKGERLDGVGTDELCVLPHLAEMRLNVVTKKFATERSFRTTQVIFAGGTMKVDVVELKDRLLDGLRDASSWWRLRGT